MNDLDKLIIENSDRSQFGALSVTPEQCAAELMEAIPSVMQFIRTEMRQQTTSLLSVPQFRVLNYLRRHPGSSLSEVAEHVGVTRATASAMTDRLVQRGLVSRVEDPNERRHVMLNLTEMGATHLQQAREATLDKIASLLNSLNPEQLTHLSSGLLMLRQVFEAAIAEPNSAK